MLWLIHAIPSSLPITVNHDTNRLVLMWKRFLLHSLSWQFPFLLKENFHNSSHSSSHSWLLCLLFCRTLGSVLNCWLLHWTLDYAHFVHPGIFSSHLNAWHVVGSHSIWTDEWMKEDVNEWTKKSITRMGKHYSSQWKKPGFELEPVASCLWF